MFAGLYYTVYVCVSICICLHESNYFIQLKQISSATVNNDNVVPVDDDVASNDCWQVLLVSDVDFRKIQYITKVIISLEF